MYFAGGTDFLGCILLVAQIFWDVFCWWHRFFGMYFAGGTHPKKSLLGITRLLV